MSDDTSSTQEVTTDAEGTTEGATPADMPQALGDAGKKALDAERTARKAAEDSAKSLQAELAKIQQASMSELEKAQAAATENLKAAEAARSEALRWRIAAKHGISDEDAETFLTGSDEDSLTKQAERLAVLAKAQAGPTTPKPDLTQGGSATPPALNGDGIESALKTKLGIR